MGEEKSVACSGDHVGECVGGVVQNPRAKTFLYSCKKCNRFASDEEANAAVWSLWEQTNTFLALGDDESAESFGKVLDEAGSKL